jgi:hypothetical protein
MTDALEEWILQFNSGMAWLLCGLQRLQKQINNF